jgi:hypothetical protein
MARRRRRKKRPRTVLHLPIRIDGLERLALRLREFEADPYRFAREGDLPDRTVMRVLNPEPDTVQPIAETVTAILVSVAGPEISFYLRRCEVCFQWMAARSSKGRRCSAKCQAKVWTRAYRESRRRAKSKPSRRRTAGA